MVASTMSREAMLGRMCRAMMTGLGTFMKRAALTYSRFFTLRVRERTTRAVSIHPNPASRMMNSAMEPLAAPARWERIAMMRKEGTTRSRSVAHRAIFSHQPPK